MAWYGGREPLADGRTDGAEWIKVLEGQQRANGPRLVRELGGIVRPFGAYIKERAPTAAQAGKMDGERHANRRTARHINR